MRAALFPPLAETVALLLTAALRLPALSTP